MSTNPQKNASEDTKGQDLEVYAEHVIFDMDDDGCCCDVCDLADQDDEDRIMFCDGCDHAVHQRCCGVEEVPKGDWFCLRCTLERRNENSEKIVCALCPRVKGIHIETKEGCIVHKSCAYWLMGAMHIDNEVAMELVDLPSIEQYSSLCHICGLYCGPVVSCMAPGCDLMAHPICGRYMGWSLNIMAEANKILTPYCREHEPLIDQLLEKDMICLDRRVNIAASDVLVLASKMRRSRQLQVNLGLLKMEPESEWKARLFILMTTELVNVVDEIKTLSEKIYRKIPKALEELTEDWKIVPAQNSFKELIRSFVDPEKLQQSVELHRNPPKVKQEVKDRS
eukprot:GDKJ01030229.1.p1 GENE.GDKJ01030229.1~~GDKJ01030229.1.p1  ORF type:complete len:338 (-),score=47.65 GDKJ01030229.1:45-1058(-)